MTYAGTRRILDADSHLMEHPHDWLAAYAEPAIRSRLGEFPVPPDLRGPLHDDALAKAITWHERRTIDEEVRQNAEKDLMERKLYGAYGAWDQAERMRALDLFGFERQLLFATASLQVMVSLPDLDLVYGAARAHNRGMIEFCQCDRRLAPVAYVPMDDVDRAVAELDWAVEAGAAAVMVPTVPPAAGPSPTHPCMDPFWARLQAADLPFVLHVGFDLRPTGGWNTIPSGFSHNDRQTLLLLPGGEGADAYGYIALSHPAQMMLSYLILDGVLERFPALRGGCIEQSATWLPSWLRHLDLAFRRMGAFHPHFSELTMAPSDYVRRQLKFTPYWYEPVGWITDQVGPNLLMFSSDYPHLEGGRDPLAAFDADLEGQPADVLDRFYWGNMAELLGRR